MCLCVRVRVCASTSPSHQEVQAHGLAGALQCQEGVLRPDVLVEVGSRELFHVICVHHAYAHAQPHTTVTRTLTHTPPSMATLQVRSSCAVVWNVRHEHSQSTCNRPRQCPAAPHIAPFRKACEHPQHTHTHSLTHSLTHTHTHSHTHSHTHAHTHPHTHTCTFTHTCTARAHAYAHARTHTHSLAHTHSLTHTHTHAHTQHHQYAPMNR
jgi:hypothetical protein